jgi:serine/threonine protein phosphatase PrpC
MVKNILSPQWLCTGRSVRGAAHDRSGLPNQDAIDWEPKSGTNLPLILAISDGHGSAKSFRSDRGSQFAVKTAIDVIQTFLLTTDNGGVHGSNLRQMGDLAERRLKQQLTERLEELVAGWQESVRQDLASFPFTDLEKVKVLKQEGEKGLGSIQANPLLVYGATLLIVVITEVFIAYLQLGDGDILRVDASGVTTKPITRDPNLIGNETTSLCMEKAWTQFKIEVEFLPQSAPSKIPVLILLSTDGYSNSYSSDEEFFKIGQDYLHEIREGGMASVDRQLEAFLSGISSGGSGDDITLGIVKRVESLDRQHHLPKRPAALEKTIKTRGSLMSAGDVNRQKKTASNSKLLGQLVSLALLLAIVSTFASGYLFFRLRSIEASLIKVQKEQSKDRDEIANLNDRIDKMQGKPPRTKRDKSLQPHPKSTPTDPNFTEYGPNQKLKL